MNLRLDTDVFKWLFDLNVISCKAKRNDNLIELDEALTAEFMNGYKIALLMKKVVNIQVIDFNIKDRIEVSQFQRCEAVQLEHYFREPQ